MMYVGLRAIGNRMGISRERVLSWNDKLGFPIFFHPTTKLKGKRIVFCADEESIQRWILTMSTQDMEFYWANKRKSIWKPNGTTD